VLARTSGVREGSDREFRGNGGGRAEECAPAPTRTRLRGRIGPRRHCAAGDDPEYRQRRAAAWHPTIRDRAVQTAAKLLLEPIFEADLDLNLWLSAGPGRDRRDQGVHALLRRGLTDVVDADLSKYFRQDPASRADALGGTQRRRPACAAGHQAVLKIPVEERGGEETRGHDGRQGQPIWHTLGGVISPLLANLRALRDRLVCDAMRSQRMPLVGATRSKLTLAFEEIIIQFRPRRFSVLVKGGGHNGTGGPTSCLATEECGDVF
jgi:hypothetical protein